MRRTSSASIPKSELITLYRQAVQSGVSLDKVESKVSSLMSRNTVSEEVESQEEKIRDKTLKKQIPLTLRLGALIVPVFLIGLGVFLVGSAVFPIVSYYITTLPILQASTLTTPIPRDQVLDITPLVIAQGASSGAQVAKSEPIMIDTQLDYTNLSNWFTDSQVQLEENQELTYTLDIPSLNVHNAEVHVGGTDLNKSLIQYPGTALPGELGAPVIFGHSVLRQFYNPNEMNPRRYTSIFSTIMTLKKGDYIYVTHEGVKYSYIVQDKIEVKPEDTYILSQKYDSHQLKLVTCVPEGTFLRRGVVIAQLVPNQ
jgi:sortase A